MRPGAAAPDDPEEVAPLAEPAAPSRRASRAWDRPVSAPPPPPGARPPARNAAVGVDRDLLRDYDQERHPFEDTDDEDGKSVGADEGFDYDPPAAASGGSPPARAKKERKVDAGTQAETGPAEWSSHDMRRALRLLHSVDAGVVKRTLRRLHIRLWHAPAARMIALLQHAGAPTAAIKMVKEIVDTCRIC